MAYSGPLPTSEQAFNYYPRATQPVLMLNGRWDIYFPLPLQERMLELLSTPEDSRKHMLFEAGHANLPRFQVERATTIRLLGGLDDATWAAEGPVWSGVVADKVFVERVGEAQRRGDEVGGVTQQTGTVRGGNPADRPSISLAHLFFFPNCALGFRWAVGRGVAIWRAVGCA